MQIGKYKYEFDFFSWIKKTELVELEGVNPADDPVRPELDNDFRTSKGRKIFGLKYKSKSYFNFIYFFIFIIIKNKYFFK